VPTAHGEAQKTLGKAFAECYTWQMALGIHRVGKRFFADCFYQALGKDFAECFLATDT